MVTVTQLTDNLKSYVSLQLDSMSKSNPMIGFMKPFITRALDKNFDKVTKTLDLISDKEGNIDIENIITEMMENLMNTNPFTFKTSFIGDIEIGGGEIKFNLRLEETTSVNLKQSILYLGCITLRMAENIVERSLICTRLRKFVKDIGEYSQHL